MESTRRTRLGFSLVAAMLLAAAPAFAQPPIWETNFGPAIVSLTGQDDATESVNLTFSFPYGNTGYTTVFVGTNGCIQLGSLGTDDAIDYDHWSYFEEFYADAAPEICPINTDWDLGTNGTVHFNDFGNRAVFTWNEIGTNQNEDALATFQVQIEQSGRIVFGYNGILDEDGEDLIGDMSEGLRRRHRLEQRRRSVRPTSPAVRSPPAGRLRALVLRRRRAAAKAVGRRQIVGTPVRARPAVSLGCPLPARQHRLRPRPDGDLRRARLDREFRRSTVSASRASPCYSPPPASSLCGVAPQRTSPSFRANPARAIRRTPGAARCRAFCFSPPLQIRRPAARR
jgi:hypothetical protein